MAPCPADSCDTSTGETCRSPMSACPCGTGIQTPEHIFQDCPTHRDVRKSNLARGSASSGEAIGISSSVEKDCRLHRQDWTDDLSMAWKRRERSGPHLPKKHNKKQQYLTNAPRLFTLHRRQRVWDGSDLWRKTISFTIMTGTSAIHVLRATFLELTWCRMYAQDLSIVGSWEVGSLVGVLSPVNR